MRKKRQKPILQAGANPQWEGEQDEAYSSLDDRYLKEEPRLRDCTMQEQKIC